MNRSCTVIFAVAVVVVVIVVVVVVVAAAAGDVVVVVDFKVETEVEDADLKDEVVEVTVTGIKV